ncbi:MOSC domain-containing protein [Halomicrobium sp. HM KBTZ05]|uniref:MOSC domain-containing protein n=1 Tax=Halomicrobium sp. HM KBTZ05 TaxID=3242663 RepID=UPI0035577F8C
MSTVSQLWTAPDAGEPMESHDTLDAVADSGLRGDRYFTGTGHYAPYDVCQVTLVSREALTHIREAFDIDLLDGRHRRNVVVDGVDVGELLDTQFRIGDAVFEGTRRRPPCAHVEKVADEAGVARALGDERGGICADVVESGAIAVGDDLTVVERLDDPDSLADAIRDRAGER